MRYIGETLRYMKKNILFLAVFAVAPAICHALLRDNKTYFDFFLDLWEGTDLSFIKVYRNFSMVVTDHSWMSLVTVAAYLIFIPLALAFVEKHMRIGSRSLTGLFSGFNSNIISTTLMLFLFLVCYELMSVILSALTVLVGMVFNGLAANAIVTVLILGFYLVMLLIATAFFVWLPCVLVTGYKYSEGFLEALMLIGSNRTKIILSLSFPLVLFNVLQIILKVCFGQIFLPVKLIIYFLYFIYYVSLCYVIYFDLSKSERMDKEKKYY